MTAERDNSDPTFDEHMVDPLTAMADHEDAPNLGLRQLSLKDADCSLLAGVNSDIEGVADGFFHDDTRLLSCFVLRILVNTVGTQTGSSMPSPTNQRNIRL